MNNNKLTFVLHTVLRSVFVLDVKFHKQCGHLRNEEMSGTRALFAAFKIHLPQTKTKCVEASSWTGFDCPVKVTLNIDIEQILTFTRVAPGAGKPS
jgi:hypothetical protein